MIELFQKYYSFFLEGIGATILIAALSVLLGTILGTLFALMRMSKIKPLNIFAQVYIEVFRGTPLMVQLMFIFYGLPMIGITFPEISFILNFQRFAQALSP